MYTKHYKKKVNNKFQDSVQDATVFEFGTMSKGKILIPLDSMYRVKKNGIKTILWKRKY